MNIPLISSIIDMAGEALERSGKRSEHRFELEMAQGQAKVTAAASLAASDANWETVMANKNNWMDDYWTIVLSIPLVLVFFPAMQQPVKDGFDALAVSVPEWYVWGLLASISAAFARRKMPDVTSWLKRRS